MLTSAGVIAVGFGDIAQLEYRHTAAISVTGVNAPVPAVGVQLKLPIPEGPNVPAFGVAFRLGVPRTEHVRGDDRRRDRHDLYLVARGGSRAPWLTLHGGTRISSAKIVLGRRSRRCSLQQHAVPADRRLRDRDEPDGEDRRRDRAARRSSTGWRDGAERAEDPTIGYGLLGRLGMRWRLLPCDHPRRQHRLPARRMPRRPRARRESSLPGTSGSVPRCSCPGARWPAAPPGRSATSARRTERRMKRIIGILATIAIVTRGTALAPSRRPTSPPARIRHCKRRSGRNRRQRQRDGSRQHGRTGDARRCRRATARDRRRSRRAPREPARSTCPRC